VFIQLKACAARREDQNSKVGKNGKREKPLRKLVGGKNLKMQPVPNCKQAELN
jgi:hypothetical protein